MNYFNPIERTNSLPKSLESVASTFRDLEQGHQNAVAFASELETAMANLDLNEAEDEWRQQKINQIKNTLTENTKYGNAAGAVDDLIRAKGDITSDPGMIGRIRAQRDFKDYMNKLDNNPNISEDIKNYYREKTKYNYNDIYNDNGKVIGGTKWEPTERPVDQVDMNNVYTKALAYMSPDAGGGNSVTFLDPATGQTSSKYTPGANWVTLNTLTGKFEKLPPEKIQAAVDAVINGNPAIKASLEQDFKIDKWKYEKNPEIFTDAYDNKGYLKTFDKYVQDKIDPFIVAKQYNNRYTSVSYNDSLLNSIAVQSMKNAAESNRSSRSSGNGRKIMTEGVPDLPSGKSASIEINSTPGVEVIGNLRKIGANINKILIDKYPDLHIPVFNENTTDSDIANITKNLTPEQTKDINNIWNTYKNATAALRYTNDSVLSKVVDPASADAYTMLQQMNLGHIDPINDNDGEALREFKTKLADIRNSYFGDSNAIGVVLSGDRMYQDFISEIGEDKIKEYGISTYKKSDGSIVVSLSAENSDGLEIFARAGNSAASKRSFVNAFNNWYGVGAGQIYKLDENGNIIEKTGPKNVGKQIGKTLLKAGIPSLPLTQNITGEVITAGMDTYASNVTDLTSMYDSFRRELSKKQDPAISSTAIVDTRIIPKASPYSILQYNIFQTSGDSREANLAKSRMDEDTDTYRDLFISNPAAVYRQNIKIIDTETGSLTTMKNDDKDEFVKLIKEADSPKDIIIPVTVRIPMDGYKPSFTLKGKENITYVIENGIYDQSFEDANNSIPNQRQNKIEKLINRNEAFQFDLNGKTLIVGKSKINPATVDLVDENFIPIKTDLSSEFITSAANLATVIEQYKYGKLNTEDKENQLLIAKAYNDYLIQSGYIDDEQRQNILQELLEDL